MLRVLGIKDWIAGGGHTPTDLGFRLVHDDDGVRSPEHPEYVKKMADLNQKLAAVGEREGISIAHFCALRMYTGYASEPSLLQCITPSLPPPPLRYVASFGRPTYYKYNFILRGTTNKDPNSFIGKYIQQVCLGNLYPTTLHYMCLGVQLLSKLTRATKVYRAPGGRLPPAFIDDRIYAGAKGGIEVLGRSSNPGLSPIMYLPCL